MDGVLKTDGSGTGTWISPERTLDSNAESYEMRVKGETLPGTVYSVSSDGGNTWQGVDALKTRYSLSPPGKNLKVKVDINSADTQITTLALLYS